MGSDDPKPRRTDRLTLGMAAVQTAFSLPMIWAGVRITEAGVLLLGPPMIALDVVTGVLSGRRIVDWYRSPYGLTSSGELPKSEFDYIVWVMLALPIIAVLLILVFVLTRGE